MLRLKMAFLFAILLSGPLCKFGYTQSDTATTNLKNELQRLIQLRRDLLEMAPRDLSDQQHLLQLESTSQSVSMYIEGTSTIMALYGMVSAEYRPLAKMYVDVQVRSYLAQLAIDIKDLNSILSVTRTAGVAATGVQVRDSFHRVQDIFNALIEK